MKKITINDFQDSTGLILITIIFSFFVGIGEVMGIESPTVVEAVIVSVIFLPLVALWFKEFWNKILLKIFQIRKISHGVAFILISFLGLIA